MDKTAIKNFAIWARNKLIADITYRASLLGITEDGIQAPLPQSTVDIQMFDIGTAEPYTLTGKAINQRAELVREIEERSKDADHKTAFHNTVEEAAYTWFNRLIALRFMEVNDYLPSRMRILSSASPNKVEPDVVTNPFDAGFDLTPEEVEAIGNLKSEDRVDDVFQLLFIKQCNALNACLPGLFEKTSDYTEVLLNLSVTDRDGVVYHLVHDIPEDNFNVNAIDDEGKPAGQIEIIGWLYQYYISEKHNEVVDPLHGKVINKDEIPAATQLFTTDWVVQYLIDNSVGRYWIERHPDSHLAEKLTYFVYPKNDKIQYIDDPISPEDLIVFDPASGSAHFGVYTFDVLMAIYAECGYSEREAAKSIVQNNLFGLDIDKRAAQLSSFAITMKALQYDRRFLRRGIIPHFYDIKESNKVDDVVVQKFVNGDPQLEKDIQSLIDDFKDAKEFGSIAVVHPVNYDALFARLDMLEKNDDMISSQAIKMLKPLIVQGKLLSSKYAVVATNPPYLNKYDPKLKKYIIDHYADYKGDLFSVFIYHDFYFLKQSGYSGFMTPLVWMFIKTYEPLRKYILYNKSISTLIQFEYSAFEEATVPICSFVIQNCEEKCKGEYFRLSDFPGGMETQRKKIEEALENPECGYFYETYQSDFSKIPGSPVAYWANKQVLKDYENNPSIDNTFETRNGMSTTNNNRFLRMWFECNYKKCGLSDYSAKTANNSDKKWFRYNKGGEFRRWYGNNQFLVNWYKNGKELKSYVAEKYGSYSKELRSEDRYFFESITWSGVTSSQTGFRFSPKGSIFDSGANGLFANDDHDLKYLLGFLNSKLVIELIKFKNPTVNTGSGTVGSLPIIVNSDFMEKIYKLVNNCIYISTKNWDSFENSWDFKKHPLIEDSASIQDAYEDWKTQANEMFKQLKANEEELNRIFINIYGLQDELTPEEDDKDVTVHYIVDQKEDAPKSLQKSNYLLTKQDVMKSFVSYAVGCMLGRYSLDVDGLAYAGGDWDESKYKTFMPDTDNVLPITDEEYLDDDIVARFVKFVETVYGTNTLEDNLTFIAGALGNRGKTSREVIRNYFLKDFYKDHCNTYQKRPIYWLYDSGKQNGFKALIYMHCYNKYTSGMVRVDYLHKLELAYSSEIERMEDTTIHSKSAREVIQAQKRIEKLKKQLKECQDYDSELGHIARDQIAIDLDDGVKVNYRKAQTGRDGKFYPILADSKKIMGNDKLWNEYLTEWPHKKEES